MTINLKNLLYLFQNPSASEGESFIIAYSGGVDSHVLLHLMADLKNKNPDLNIKAIHINHQLNPNSNQWEAHCKKICENLEIELMIEKITINLKAGDSLEEQARLARYKTFEKYIEKNSVLLTAHNLNDQAETFLLQALRGAGPKGLSAMPIEKKLGLGKLVRPLLSYSRADILEYAKKHQLIWMEDDSNLNNQFDRNFLRNTIFPKLLERKPAVFENFSRSARLLAEHEKIISEISREDFEKIKTEQITKIDLKKLLLLSNPRQRLVLREWLLQNNIRSPSEKQLKQIQQDVLYAKTDAHPIFRLNDFCIKRSKEMLILAKERL